MMNSKRDALRENASDTSEVGGIARDRIRMDLERRGVAPDFSEALAVQLEGKLAELETDAYEPLLDGAAAAYGIQCETRDGWSRNLRELKEVERLMGAFAGELAKLDEVLEVLTAYLRRLHSNSPQRGTRTLH